MAVRGITRATDTVARLGGDEFVILLGDITTLAELTPSLTRILSQLSAPYRVTDQSAQMSASIGVTLYPRDDADPDTLLRHADQAMYQAKHEFGEAKVVLYGASMDQAQAQWSSRIAHAVVEAADRGVRVAHDHEVGAVLHAGAGLRLLAAGRQNRHGADGAQDMPCALHHDFAPAGGWPACLEP